MTNAAATATAPLQNYRVVGVDTRWYSPTPEVRMPGGSCWHCGTAIAICVQVQNVTDPTEEVHTIGTTCAERIGLDPEGLKNHLADKYAAERAARSAAANAERRAEHERREAEETAAFGEHGKLTRFESGCRCDACSEVAPHGKWRFRVLDCRCPECVVAMLDETDYYEWPERTALVDLETGRIIEDARIVSTRYGVSWRSDALDLWAPVNPARRSTLAKRGLTEAEAPALCISGRIDRHSRDRRVFAWLGSPIVDAWGEPILRPTA